MIIIAKDGNTCQQDATQTFWRCSDYVKISPCDVTCGVGDGVACHRYRDGDTFSRCTVNSQTAKACLKTIGGNFMESRGGGCDMRYLKVPRGVRVTFYGTEPDKYCSECRDCYFGDFDCASDRNPQEDIGFTQRQMIYAGSDRCSLSIRLQDGFNCVCQLGQYMFRDIFPSECFDCNPGYYSDTTSTKLCKGCAAGTYSEKQAGSCTPCPAGTYSDEEAAKCTFCDPGSVPNTGSTGCVNCGAGKKSVKGDAVCTTCVAGTSSPEKSGTCNLCDVGKTSTGGAASCTNCPADRITNAERICICPFQTLASGRCVNCASNLLNADQTTCLCLPGQALLSNGETCLNCGLGRALNSAKTACETCDSGRYSGYKDGGSDQFGNGASVCSVCPAGRGASMDYNVNRPAGCSDQNGYVPCPLFGCSYQTQADLASRTNCRSTSVWAATSCVQCTPGQYMGSAVFDGSSDCNANTEPPCTNPQYRPITNSQICIDCPPGQVRGRRGTGASSCVLPEPLNSTLSIVDNHLQGNLVWRDLIEPYFESVVLTADKRFLYAAATTSSGGASIRKMDMENINAASVVVAGNEKGGGALRDGWGTAAEFCWPSLSKGDVQMDSKSRFCPGIPPTPRLVTQAFSYPNLCQASSTRGPTPRPQLVLSNFDNILWVLDCGRLRTIDLQAENQYVATIHSLPNIDTLSALEVHPNGKFLIVATQPIDSCKGMLMVLKQGAAGSRSQPVIADVFAELYYYESCVPGQGNAISFNQFTTLAVAPGRQVLFVADLYSIYTVDISDFPLDSRDDNLPLRAIVRRGGQFGQFDSFRAPRSAVWSLDAQYVYLVSREPSGGTAIVPVMHKHNQMLQIRADTWVSTRVPFAARECQSVVPVFAQAVCGINPCEATSRDFRPEFGAPSNDNPALGASSNDNCCECGSGAFKFPFVFTAGTSAQQFEVSLASITDMIFIAEDELLVFSHSRALILQRNLNNPGSNNGNILIAIELESFAAGAMTMHHFVCDIGYGRVASTVVRLLGYQTLNVCEACLAGSAQNLTSNGIQECVQCGAGKYSGAKATACITCPFNMWGGTSAPGSSSIKSCTCGRGRYPTPLLLQTGNTSHCTACRVNTVSNSLDATNINTCQICAAGSYSIFAVSPSEAAIVCLDCPAGTFGSGDGEGCKVCPRGSISLIPASLFCDLCKACPYQMYRTNCTSGRGAGLCVNCAPCSNPLTEVRQGCLNNIGHNDEVGSCILRTDAVQAPLCPRKTTYLGELAGELAERDAYLEQSDLGGYTFLQVFGVEFANATFQCRRLCDGKPRDDNLELDVRDQDSVPGLRDTGTCAGPFACNIAACTMVTNYDEQILNTRTPRACPVILRSEDATTVLAAKQTQQCQDCATCGNPNLDPGFKDYGSGCAKECTRLVCTEPNTIYDWTDGFPVYDTGLALNNVIERCKFCGELRDYRLCAGGGLGGIAGLGSFSASDVSGNRPLMRFEDCMGREDGVVAQYGRCEFCPVSGFTCLEQEYPSTCTTTESTCAACLSRSHHGPQLQVVVSLGSFLEANSLLRSLFCQVSCVTGYTGVKNNNPAICYRSCAPEGVCRLTEFALLCVVPHDFRCVLRFPQLVEDDPRVQSTLGEGTIMLPAHANMLESVAETSSLFTSFENVFIDLRADKKDLHQCVWNAVDVRDNDKTPGGVSFTFWPPAQAYAFPLTTMGSKWCQWSLNGANTENTPWSAQAFLRNRDVLFPLLPLQNVVGSVEPRRMLLNTSARAMRYCESLENDVCEGGYDGSGEGLVVAQQAVGRPVIDGARARVGDLFLGLEMQLARNATILILLPPRIQSLTWVPGWRFSYFARDISPSNQPWVKARHYHTDVVALLRDSTPTVHSLPSILTAEGMQNVSLDLSGSGSAQNRETAVLWSSTQPVLVCNNMSSAGTVYISSHYIERMYSYTPAESSKYLTIPRGLLLAFPGLALGDPELGSGPILRSLAPNPASTGSGACLRPARRSSTCVAYYSSQTKIYCVHVNMSASVLFTYLVSACPAGDFVSGGQCEAPDHVTDFVVLETEAGDEMLVRQLNASMPFSQIHLTLDMPDRRSVTELPLEISSDTRNILQYATDRLNPSKVVVVRCTAGCEAIQLCSTNFQNASRIDLFVDVSLEAQAEVLASQTWTYQDVLLTVGPEGVIFVALVSPDGRWIWCAWYNAVGTRLAMRFHAGAEMPDLTTLTNPVLLSSSWIDSRQVLLGRPDPERPDSRGVCLVSYQSSLSEISCTRTSPLDGLHFVRVLNGYVVQDPSTHALRVLTQLRGMEVLKPGDCASAGSFAAAFHALIDGPSEQSHVFSVRRGPIYVAQGQAIRLDRVEELDILKEAPDLIYDIRGQTLTNSLVAKVTLRAPESALGYNFVVECDCDYPRGQAELRVGEKTFTAATLGLVCMTTSTGQAPKQAVVRVQVQLRKMNKYRVSHQGPDRSTPMREWNDLPDQNLTQTTALFLPAGCRSAQMRKGLFADHLPEEVLGLSQWQHVQHTLSAAVVQASTAIAVQFVRVATTACPSEDGVPGDCFDKLDVLGLDAIELLVDLVLPGRGGQAGWTAVTMHVPTVEELEAASLSQARRGSDITDWERLHVTLGVRRDAPGADACNYRVRLLPRGCVGTIVIQQLGCSMTLFAGLNYSECQLEIPISASNDGLAQLNVSLVPGAPASCPDPSLLARFVVLAPMTTLYSCGSNEFWSEDTRLCVSCDSPTERGGGGGFSAEACPPGEYVHGCDRLQTLAQVRCLPCPKPTADSTDEAFNKTSFWGPGICNLQCVSGYYRSPDQRCVSCTVDLINTCSRTAGLQWQSCSETENEQCVPCPAIQKGLQSRFEEFVANNFTDCVTRCLPRHYRSSSPPYACFPCSSYANVLRLTSIESVGVPYFRFQECSAAADTTAVRCEEQDNNIITGQALAVGEDCPRSCDVGTQLKQNNMQLATVTVYPQAFWYFLQQVYTPPTYFYTWRLFSCAVCESVVAPGGANLPTLAYTLLPFCDYECNQSMGFYRRNGSRTPSARECSQCGTSSSSVCGIGQYPVGYNCSICVDCSLPIIADGWEFTSGGTVDEPTSCAKRCMTGMFADFDVCKPYSNVSCLVGEYLLKGTFTSDNFCAECVSCEGQRRVRNCSETVNGICRSCGEPFGGQVFVGENCTAVCVGASVLDVRTGICEICRFECAPGFTVAANRQNCTHCEACPLPIPKGAAYVGGCSWTCVDGLVVRNGSRLTCQALPTIATRDPRAATLRSTSLPRCPLGQELLATSYTSARCVACSVVTPGDPQTFTWSSMGLACEWTCLDGLFKFFQQTASGERVECLTLTQFRAQTPVILEVSSSAGVSISSFCLSYFAVFLVILLYLMIS